MLLPQGSFSIRDASCQRSRGFVMSPTSLFMSQRGYGIDAGGAPRWNVTGCQRHHNEQQCDADERRRIGGADVEQQTLNYSSQCECPTNAERNTDDCEANALAQHEPKNVALMCSQCHPDAQFLSPQRDRVGDYTINSNNGEQQSRASE